MTRQACLLLGALVFPAALAGQGSVVVTVTGIRVAQGGILLVELFDHASGWLVLDSARAVRRIPITADSAIATFDSLPADQQKAISEVGASLEPFALEQAQADDKRLAAVYGKAGVGVHEFDKAALAKWQAIARDTAWKDFAKRNAACANLLGLAEKVPA